MTIDPFVVEDETFRALCGPDGRVMSCATMPMRWPRTGLRSPSAPSPSADRARNHRPPRAPICGSLPACCQEPRAARAREARPHDPAWSSLKSSVCDDGSNSGSL